MLTNGQHLNAHRYSIVDVVERVAWPKDESTACSLLERRIEGEAFIFRIQIDSSIETKVFIS